MRHRCQGLLPTQQRNVPSGFVRCQPPCRTTSSNVAHSKTRTGRLSLDWRRMTSPPVAAGPVGTEDLKAAQAAQDQDPEGAKSADYSTEMQAKMGTTLTYDHSLGLNYNRVLPDLVVGSCLQTAADVDRLADTEDVTTIFCLQEDSDMEYFSLDVKPIEDRCRERGDIQHVRFRIRDFDPFDLRKKLPDAVKALAKAHPSSREGTIYIHCTAGLGRAPATALAYMTWLRDWQLDQAFRKLRGVRMCSPRLEAIRAASADLLMGMKSVSTTISVWRTGTNTKMQVAGLDVGWHQRLDMKRDNKLGFVLHRDLMPGRYQFKLIADDMWSASWDHPVMKDGDNSNNWLEVLPRGVSDEVAAQQSRLLSPDGELLPEERKKLQRILIPDA